MPIRVLKPKELGEPLGTYSYGVVAPGGEIVVVAGQVAVDTSGKVVGEDIVAQTKQVLENIKAVLAAAGCTMESVIRFQSFLTRAEDIDGFNRARRDLFPAYFPAGAYPPNTLLVVSRLARPEFLVEIEAMAVKER